MRQTGVWLVTSPVVSDEAEKRRLAGAYGAGLVDMEAAAVARLAAMRGIPFYCVKGVSDGFNDKLPDFNRFISATGQFRLTRFILFVLLRPWHWPALVRMGENSRRAAIGLADSLLDILDERGTIRTRNGYPNLKS
jgi:adenosylhomocysteine nucleosidase